MITDQSPMLQAKPKALTSQELDELAINTIRTLSIDAVQQENSGHPGTPMALAPLVYVIWNEVMRFDPLSPIWPNLRCFGVAGPQLTHGIRTSML
jgi:transketolase N-terminal domain/subunit